MTQTDPGSTADLAARATDPADPVPGGATTPPPAEVLPSAGRQRAALLVLCSSLALVLAANSSLAVALPEIGVRLGAGQRDLTWVMDSYALLFASLLLPFGIAADRYGQRLLLVAGLVLFGGGCLVSGFVSTPEALIGLRALAGVGAAAVFPVTLAALVTTFPPERRAFAVAVWSAVSAGGSAIGLVAAGVLLELFWWGSVQVAFGVLALLVVPGALAVVPQRRQPGAPLDLPGAFFAVVGMGGLVFGVVEAPEYGWTALPTLAGLSVGVLGLGAFVLVELRSPHPALDVRLFRSRGLAAGSVLMSLQFFTALGVFTLLPQQLQVARGAGPMQVALVMLVVSATAGLGSATAQALSKAHGPRLPATAGLATMAAGTAALAWAAPAQPLWVVCAALGVFGVGFGLGIVPGTVLILDGLPEDRRSVASAVNDITREGGGVIGVAVLSSVLLAAYRQAVEPVAGGLPPELAELVRSGAGPAQAVVEALGTSGPAVSQAATTAYSTGTQGALLVGSAVLLVAALVCGLLAPPPPRGRHARVGPPPAAGGSTRSDRPARHVTDPEEVAGPRGGSPAVGPPRRHQDDPISTTRPPRE